MDVLYLTRVVLIAKLEPVKTTQITSTYSIGLLRLQTKVRKVVMRRILKVRKRKKNLIGTQMMKIKFQISDQLTETKPANKSS